MRGGFKMGCSILHDSIRTVLEEDSMAYVTMLESGGVPNMDYAGYCCHISINRLRNMLNDPTMSAERLEGLLRRAARKYSCDTPEDGWSVLMARYLARHVNGNRSSHLNA